MMQSMLRTIYKLLYESYQHMQLRTPETIIIHIVIYYSARHIDRFSKATETDLHLGLQLL
jgi:hypothetical protein